MKLVLIFGSLVALAVYALTRPTPEDLAMDKRIAVAGYANQMQIHLAPCPQLKSVRRMYSDLYSLAILSMPEETLNAFQIEMSAQSQLVESQVKATQYADPAACERTKDQLNVALGMPASIFMEELLKEERQRKPELGPEVRLDLMLPTLGSQKDKVAAMRKIILCELNSTLKSSSACN